MLAERPDAPVDAVKPDNVRIGFRTGVKVSHTSLAPSCSVVSVLMQAAAFRRSSLLIERSHAPELTPNAAVHCGRRLAILLLGIFFDDFENGRLRPLPLRQRQESQVLLPCRARRNGQGRPAARNEAIGTGTFCSGTARGKTPGSSHRRHHARSTADGRTTLRRSRFDNAGLP